MRTRTILFATVLLVATAAGAEAQDRFEFKAGIGPTLSTYSNMSLGAHAFAAAELYAIDEILALRLDGLAGVANYAYRGVLPGEDPQTTESRRIDLGIRPLYSANAALVLREPPGDYRLYALFGVGYNYFEHWSRDQPVEHDFGYVFGGGLIAKVAGRSWFVELKGHAFGNTMSSVPTNTKSFAPLTFGLVF